jgi:hypothetical protein
MLKCLLLALSAALMWGQNTPAVNTPISSWPAGAIPVWTKYSVAKTAGNWLVNGANSQAATATTTQAINIFTIPANGYIHAFRIKTTTACAGVTLLAVSSVGVTGAATLFNSTLAYDLKAAVSATNISLPLLAAQGSNTAASTTFTVTVDATAQNISSVTDGCAFDVHVLSSVLP